MSFFPLNYVFANLYLNKLELVLMQVQYIKNRMIKKKTPNNALNNETNYLKIIYRILSDFFLLSVCTFLLDRIERNKLLINI
jgi:uncharacterized membrane protein